MARRSHPAERNLGGGAGASPAWNICTRHHMTGRSRPLQCSTTCLPPARSAAPGHARSAHVWQGVPQPRSDLWPVSIGPYTSSGCFSARTFRKYATSTCRYDSMRLQHDTTDTTRHDTGRPTTRRGEALYMLRACPTTRRRDGRANTVQPLRSLAVRHDTLPSPTTWQHLSRRLLLPSLCVWAEAGMGGLGTSNHAVEGGRI